MSDLGTRIHALVEWTAPPIDGYEITRGRAPRPARWVPILAAFVVVLVIGGFTFVFGGWQPGDPVADATSIPGVDVTDPVAVDDPVVTTTYAEEPIRQLTPVRVDCLAELDAFPCLALVDGDPETEWQAPDGGVGIILSFGFAQPVEIESIAFTNVVDDNRFVRNHRISAMEIAMDDLAQATFVELPDSNDSSHRIQTRSLRTTVVTITITGTYPGVRVDDLDPFSELALAEVEFFGRGPAGEHFDPESTLIIGTMESGPVPELVACPGGSQDLGTVEMMSFATPPLALEGFLTSFDGGAPRLATTGYMELGQADGSIVYGTPLNRSNLDEGYSTLITVQPGPGNGWTVTSWEASVC